MRKLISVNLPVVIVLVHFRQAFESVHRSKLLKILKAYGDPGELVNAIGKLYENTCAGILSSDSETDEFDILAGALQGDTLAPYLFTIVLDYALKQALDKDINKPRFTLKQKSSRRYPAFKISDLDFAYGIDALILDQIEEAQTTLVNVAAKECLTKTVKNKLQETKKQ